MGALREVSLPSQFFSIPSVIERNRIKSQTTREITNTDIRAIKARDILFLLGCRYRRNIANSNTYLFFLFKHYMLSKRWIILHQLQSRSGILRVFYC